MINFRKTFPLLTLILALLVLPVSPTVGQPTTKDSKAPSAKSDTLVKPEQSVTSGSVVIGGKTIQYEATAGTLPIYSNEGKAIAKIGYVAYLKKGVSDVSKRPLLFGFNGGPGSASIWVHMGTLGPKLVKVVDAGPTPTAPYEIVNNEYSALDLADVVIIDMPGAGFSRAVGDTENKYFWTETTDIDAFSRFIMEFVNQHNRWNSPKYIFGESYGAYRSPGIVENLFNKGIALNGVLDIGTVWDFRALGGGAHDNFSYMIYLPSFAATAWHYNKINKPGTLEDFMVEVQNFAIEEYAPALLKGNTLSSAERTKIVNKLVQYTGLERDFIEESNLRINPTVFRTKILEKEKKVVGRYDSRFNGDAMGTSRFSFFDPSSAFISPAYQSMYLQYLHETLKFGKDKQYMFSASGLPGFKWEYNAGGGFGRQSSPNSAPTLERAMKISPYLKVHIFSGYHDLATPFFGSRYSVSQMDLPENQLKNIKFTEVIGGHMAYLNMDALKAIHEALDDLINGKD